MAEYTFHTPGPLRVDVKVPVGDVEIETIDGDESRVELDGPQKLLDETQVELVGDRLVVELRRRFFVGLSGLFEGGFRVRMRVPHGSRATLATASADMTLRGRFAELDTRSASGDLALDGTVERDANVKTVSGDAQLGDVGGALKVQTVSGDVRAASIGRGVTVKSVSGDVRVESAREGEVTVQSVSGDIEIGVAPGTGLDVDANSVSGDLASDVALGSDPTLADGGGPTLVVRGKTVSGDFRVFRAA